MRDIAEKAYNEELIQLKTEKQLTAIKLSQLVDININTIKSWLVNPSSTKWRKLDRSIFYLIKSKLVFIDDKNSFGQRSNAEFLSGLIDDALLMAKHSILSKQPLTDDDLSFINQALEVNGILRWRLDSLVRMDQEEIEYFENLADDNFSISDEKKNDESIFMVSHIS